MARLIPQYPEEQCRIDLKKGFFKRTAYKGEQDLYATILDWVVKPFKYHIHRILYKENLIRFFISYTNSVSLSHTHAHTHIYTQMNK